MGGGGRQRDTDSAESTEEKEVPSHQGKPGSAITMDTLLRLLGKETYTPSLQDRSGFLSVLKVSPVRA